MVPHDRLLARGVAASLALAVLASTSYAAAEQVVVLDETWVHTPDLPDSHHRVDPSASTPASWVSPVDYSQGTAHVHLEVHTKPTDQETRFQVCFEATPTYACTDQSPTYTTTGTYAWSTPFSSFYQPPGENVDWSQGVNRVAAILKDTRNNKPSSDNVGDEVAALYTPTEVRMVVTIVTPGGTYEPPAPTGEGGAGGGSAASGSTASSSAATTSGSSATGGTSSGASSSGTPTTTASGPSTSGATSGAGGSGGAGGDPGGGGGSADTGDDGGCAIGPARCGSPQGGIALLVAVSLARRARRPRSRRRA